MRMTTFSYRLLSTEEERLLVRLDSCDREIEVLGRRREDLTRKVMAIRARQMESASERTRLVTALSDRVPAVKARLARTAVVVLALLLPVSVAAQPDVTSVSGTVVHGGAITVSGTGFGTKGTAAPLAYDDWQSVALGADVDTSTAASWTTTTDPRPPVASNARLRAGTPFTRNMRAEWQIADTYGQVSANLTGQNFTKLYLDAWLYHDTASEPSGTNLNVKWWRLHETGWGEPNWYSNAYRISDTDGLALGVDDVIGGTLDDTWNCAWFASSPCGGTRPGLSDFYNNWHHWQYALNFGTEDTANGSAYIYKNGVLVASWTGMNMLRSGFGGDYDDLGIGNYVRTDNPTVTHYAYWESVYVDTNTMRVELSDNATYASATHREILIPSAWSATSITATVNRGSFTPGASVYVCVTDASENHDCAGPYTLQAEAPTITSTSGTWNHGNSVTVTGAGFGTHTDWGQTEAFLNAAWNDFSSTLEDGNLALMGGYPGLSTIRWTRQTANPRGNPAGAYARKIFDTVNTGDSPRLGSLSHTVSSSGTATRFYVSFWHRIASPLADQASGKHFRFYFGPNSSVHNFWTSTEDCDPGPCSTLPMQSHSELVGGTPQIWGSEHGNWISGNTWVWNEYLMCLTGCTSIFGSSDYVETRVNGVRWWRRGSGLPSNPRSGVGEGSNTNENHQWIGGAAGDADTHTLDLGMMIDGEAEGCNGCDDSNSYYHFSDAYMNYGFQRVCISAQSTWAAVTQCEMQIPTAWSNTSLTVTANRGSYADFNNKYLYVCDYDNECNANGYALSGGGDPPSGRSRIHVIGVFAVLLAGMVRFKLKK